MSLHDDLPNEAFTELEHDAGVPGIVRGTGFRFSGRLVRVSEADCVSLIIRALVVGTDSTEPDVVHPDGHLGQEYDLGNLRGLTPANASQTEFTVLTNGYRIPVAPLLGALRKTGVPYFGGNGWLAWDEASQSLASALAQRHRQFCEFARVPERSHVFQLLRTAYLSSDYVLRPVLVRNEHLAAALAKKPIPFAEPRSIGRDQLENFSLVYFTSSGEVASVPLPEAYAVRVAVSTRVSTFSSLTGPLRPFLDDCVLTVNGFGMSVVYNCQRFRYFLRRNEGTVFQSAFEQIDLPSGMSFWKCDPASVRDSANRISHWAAERNATVYVTTAGHPLQPDTCESVTTPTLYADAVRKLQEFGFKLNNSSGGDGVAVYSTADGTLVHDGAGQFGERWKPAGI